MMICPSFFVAEKFCKDKSNIYLLQVCYNVFFEIFCYPLQPLCYLFFFIEQRVQEYLPSRNTLLRRRSRKEVFQPHLPVRLPCYDLAPITSFTLGRPLRLRTSGTPGFHGLTGGVYKARERIHRAMADARLLANPASWSRVADSSPN